MKKNFILLLLLTSFLSVTAQPARDSNIPLSRMYFHEAIDATQKKILASDGINDAFFTPTSNDALNSELTDDVTKGVNDIRDYIEADSTLDNNNKIKFLRGLNEMLL